MGSTVLIVDDNEKNRKLFRVVLQKSGYETLEAVDGSKGIELARESMPDLIVMDIQMPVMDGIQAIKILKSEEATSNIPVIAATSYAMKGDKEKMLNNGFDDYMSKPINVNDFIEIVKKYIN